MLNDTIEAKLAQELVLTLRDSSLAPIAGDSIRFEAHMSPDLPSHYAATVAVGTTATYDFVKTGVTSKDGRIRVWLRLGNQVGTGYLTATRVLTGTRDSITFSVRAGSPYKFSISAGDTSVWIGDVINLGAAVRDRGGNPTSEVVHVSATGNGASISTDGIATATEFGSMFVTATWLSQTALPLGTKTARLTVVPKGVLAAIALTSSTRGIYGMNSNGSNQRWIYSKPAVPSTPTISWPTLSPDGSVVAFIEGNSIRVVPTAGGAAKTIVSGGIPSVSEYFAPQFSVDGLWIYFSGSGSGSPLTIWRVPEAGGAAEQVGLPDDGPYSSPSPNPAGDTLVFQIEGAAAKGTAGYAIELMSPDGTISNIDVPGWAPRWSPIGGTIAYLNEADTVHFMHPDGTLIRRSAWPLQYNFNWSPDGQWVVGISGNPDIAEGIGFVHFVNVATDLMVTLPFHGPAGSFELHAPTMAPLP